MNIEALKEIAADAQSQDVDILLAEYGFQVRSSRRSKDGELLSMRHAVSWADVEQSEGEVLTYAIQHVRQSLDRAEAAQ